MLAEARKAVRPIINSIGNREERVRVRRRGRRQDRNGRKIEQRDKLSFWGPSYLNGKKMEQQLESAKHQAVTIAATSGTCTPTPPKIKLNTLEDVRRETARVYREARGGMIDVSEAARFTYILVGIGKLIEATDLEKRLSLMERKLLK